MKLNECSVSGYPEMSYGFALFRTFYLNGAGYCVLGGSYNGFSSLSNSVVSCVMTAYAKWNFNAIITEAQQGRSIGWLFQIFILLVCGIFFGFMNYIVLSMIYVRWVWNSYGVYPAGLTFY